MKKVFLCAAAVAMLGLAACSNKAAEAADTATVDSDSVNVEVAQFDSVAVDSINDSTVAVSETVETVAVETPAN